ncbi:hypothetical protein F5Y17DRAFT_41149 [Xylariaceae sp. FL0594]|nr:hypothetical protein F5Y17DRAFT_41149 [Xylariaceae sp. FL0594]
MTTDGARAKQIRSGNIALALIFLLSMAVTYYEYAHRKPGVYMESWRQKDVSSPTCMPKFPTDAAVPSKRNITYPVSNAITKSYDKGLVSQRAESFAKAASHISIRYHSQALIYGFHKRALPLPILSNKRFLTSLTSSQRLKTLIT